MPYIHGHRIVFPERDHHRRDWGWLRAFVVIASVVGLLLIFSCNSDTGVASVLVVAAVDVEPSGGDLVMGKTLQLTATPRTEGGIVLPDRTITWSSSDNSRVTVSPAGLVSAVALGGPVRIQATVSGVPGEAAITVVPVPIDHITVTPSAPTIQVGQSVQLSATAFDAGGATLANRPFVWSTGAAGTAAVTTTGLVLGVAEGGPVAITAKAEGKSGAAQVTVAHRPATRLGFLQQPGAGAAGAALTPPIRVAIQDDLLNTVANATNSVTMALAANPGGATLGGTTTVAAVNGVATFSDLTVDKAGAGYTLMASATGLSSTTSNAFNVSPGAATPIALAVTTQPSATAQVGVTFARQPVLQLVNAAASPVAQSGVTVSVSISSGPLGGTLSGTTTVPTGASGAAAFSNLAITGLPGTYVLAFASTGLVGATSASIVVSVGSASRLGMTTQPSPSVVSGVEFPQQPVVQLRDAGGNAVPQAGIVITAAIQTGGGTLGGNTTATTTAAGSAAFSKLSITGLAGTRTLGFSAAGFTPVASSGVAVTAGTATQLTITAQPSASASSGVAFPQQPVLQLRDGSGNPVAQANLAVTASINSCSFLAALSGTTTVTTNASGAAAFTNLSISNVLLIGGGTCTLNFSAGGPLQAVSATITVS